MEEFEIDHFIPFGKCEGSSMGHHARTGGINFKTREECMAWVEAQDNICPNHKKPWIEVKPGAMGKPYRVSLPWA